MRYYPQNISRTLGIKVPQNATLKSAVEIPKKTKNGNFSKIENFAWNQKLIPYTF